MRGFCGKRGDGDNAFPVLGEGMHADGEYVVWQSVEELARIQIEYLKSRRMLKSGRKYRAAARAGNGGKTGVSPLRPMAA